MSTELSALLAFAAASSLLTVIPGLDTALILRTAVVEARRNAFIAGLGICSGVLIWGLLASTGESGVAPLGAAPAVGTSMCLG